MELIIPSLFLPRIQWSLLFHHCFFREYNGAYYSIIVSSENTMELIIPSLFLPRIQWSLLFHHCFFLEYNGAYYSIIVSSENTMELIIPSLFLPRIQWSLLFHHCFFREYNGAYIKPLYFLVLNPRFHSEDVCFYNMINFIQYWQYNVLSVVDKMELVHRITFRLCIIEMIYLGLILHNWLNLKVHIY